MEINNGNRINRETLEEQAFKSIKNMIVSQELRPGERVVHDSLAKVLNISRTPVKKALTRLVELGLVVNSHKGQTFVRQLSNNEIVMIYDVREVLEGLSARLAANNANFAQIEVMKKIFDSFRTPMAHSQWKDYAKADLKFHEFLAQISNNQILCEIFQRSILHLYSIRANRVKSVDVSLREHLEVIAAIHDRNPELAEGKMRSHIKNTKNKIIEGLQMNETGLLEKPFLFPDTI